jgi:hypothetical protein
MSSVAGSLNLVPRRQYVSTGDFTTRFFTYTQTGTTARGVPIFALSQVSNTPGTFPKGHILRENGRKLVKDVNPSLNDPTNTAVQYTYLVGVINTTADPNVAGFIDPNSPLFAPFNTDKTYFLDDPNEAKDASTGLQDLGPPVYTRGDITTTAGNLVIGTGRLTVGANVAGQTTLVAGTKAITVTGITTSSLVFISVHDAIPGLNGNTVSYKGFCGSSNTLSITAVKTDGLINVTDVSVVNWFVVN